MFYVLYNSVGFGGSCFSLLILSCVCLSEGMRFDCTRIALNDYSPLSIISLKVIFSSTLIVCLLEPMIPAVEMLEKRRSHKLLISEYMEYLGVPLGQHLLARYALLEYTVLAALLFGFNMVVLFGLRLVKRANIYADWQPSAILSAIRVVLVLIIGFIGYQNSYKEDCQPHSLLFRLQMVILLCYLMIRMKENDPKKWQKAL